MDNFADRLRNIQTRVNSNVGVFITPYLNQMPLLIQAYDEPFMPFGKTIIDATRDLVCAYIFDFSAYMALGAAGAIALERTIPYASDTALTILHGPFVGQGYAAMAGSNAFNVDAITLFKADDAEGYLEQGLGVFIDGMAEQHPYGYLDSANQRFIVPAAQGNLTINFAGEDILYADCTQHFAASLRRNIEHLRASKAAD
ncbi:MAG: hypothetical protein CUN55_15820 [Phototrophicales bacterium]|nr:MAG: hypothetical protein CUN55_15820 [Phototrophicales bacterium]RMG90138.1 MAG: hypothetical protein D6712_00365 [Chloroflexota bacterium]